MCQSISLPVSMIMRINILKMNMLPKLLYLFQNVPLSPPWDFFSKIKSIFVRFIWNNRRARLCLSLLYLTFDRGDLNCPNLLWYYWAVQQMSILFYFSTNEPQTLDWNGISQFSISLSPIHILRHSNKTTETN